jgi:pimeloyl-ACP methyl ester carboxylesterase
MFGRPDNWRRCADHLSRNYEVLVPALPVFDGQHHYIGVHGLSRFLHEFMQQHEVKQAVIGGNSLGGHVALQFALEWPGRVLGLILTGSSGIYERTTFGTVPLHPTREWLRARAREVFHDGAHVTEEIVDDIQSMLGDRRRRLNALRVAQSTRRSNLRNLLHRIHCPVLLAWGAQDTITPPDVAREFLANLPSAHLEFIPECGHAAPIERPLHFNRLVEGFLSRLDFHRAQTEQPVPVRA